MAQASNFRLKHKNTGAIQWNVFCNVQSLYLYVASDAALFEKNKISINKKWQHQISDKIKGAVTYIMSYF